MKSGSLKIGAKTTKSCHATKENNNLDRFEIPHSVKSIHTQSSNSQKQSKNDRLNPKKQKSQKSSQNTITPSVISFMSAYDEVYSSISDNQGIIQVGIRDIGELFSDAASQSVCDMKSIKNDDEPQIFVYYPPHLYKE